MKNKQNRCLKNLTINEDSSINYKTTIIDNDFKYQLDINELREVFNKNPEDIFKYDTSKCISFILDTGTEIPLCKYQANCKPIFIKLSDDFLQKSDNEILILCTGRHGMSNKTVWQTSDIQLLEINDNNENGYYNCINISKKDTSKSAIAVNYCLNKNITINNNDYQGYLPSIQQLEHLYHKFYLILNYIFKYTKSIPINWVEHRLWSSIEVGSKNALIYKVMPNVMTGGNELVGYTVSALKNSDYFKSSALPFFKKIN